MIGALLAASAFARNLREPQAVRQIMKSGDKVDFTFPPNSAVIFGNSLGFRVDFSGTRAWLQRRRTLIGTRPDHSDVAGCFFGSVPGVMVIEAFADCQVTFLALIPPEGCYRVFISTGASEVFQVGPRIQANASDVPRSLICFWHLGVSPRRFRLRLNGLLPRDSVRQVGRASEDLRRKTDFAFSEEIFGLSFRTTEKSPGRSLEVVIAGMRSPSLPDVHASLIGNSPPTLIVRTDRPGKSGKMISINLSYPQVFLIGLLVVMGMAGIVGVMIATVAAYRACGGNVGRRRIHSGNDEIIKRKGDIGRGKGKLDAKGPGGDQWGIPMVLTQGSRFQQAPE
jgi:hypothetical protein